MITIEQLLKMPVGERIGGGFILTVKSTKKYVCLSDGSPVYTVILFDTTGEMLADFKGVKGTYTPLIKGEQIKIIVAQVQAADPDSRLKVLETGKKLYIEQFEKLTQTLNEFEQEMDAYKLEWDKQVAGKIRHGLVCSYIRAGKTIGSMDKEIIEKLVEYIISGE